MLIPTFVMVLGLAVPGPVDGVAPADATTLEPVPITSGTARLPLRPSPTPWSRRAGIGVGAAAGVLAIGSVVRRRREPVYVLVHGDGGTADDFDRLLFQMGVGRDQTVAFDYRSVRPGATSTEASRTASTTTAAAALDRMIRSLARRHGSVYSIHHSRGGAVGVEMIAALDDGRRPPIEGYRGAALLDPAIASGRLGWLQRLGGLVSMLPDNGGFDPIRCTDDCRDVRHDLGRASGVEVIAIRNPDALVTNYVDRPLGLRTYDLHDDGGRSALARWWNPVGFVQRVFEAHGSVLEHPSVAACVRAESHDPGSCRWRAGRRRRPMWGRGRGRNVVR